MEEKYIFDEVTEPFEWPADVPTAEESMKRLNEILQHNGILYKNIFYNFDLNDPASEYSSAVMRGAHNIKSIYEVLGLNTIGIELDPEDCLIASKWPVESMTDGLNKIIAEARKNNGTD